MKFGNQTKSGQNSLQPSLGSPANPNDEQPHMEFIPRNQVTVLSNAGVESHQLLFPENSASTRVTITKVTVAPGAVNPPHRHETSEQVWVALAGSGTLLLGRAETLPFQAGDVVRFAEGDVHGFENTGSDPFVYVSVTSPPINFRAAYAQSWPKGSVGAA
jgi:mannose-6-phosphate isomerase-like protein (cupin superfamily)